MNHIFSVASENLKNSTFFLLFLLTVAGAFIRIHGLGEWYYYSDEMWHVYVAKQPGLRNVFYADLAEDGHAPLPYFIWHYLLLLWDNPWMARLPSLIAGILLIPLGYIAGKRLFEDRNFGLFAAFFFAFSGIFVMQSQVVRGYILMLMFTVLAIWSIACYRDSPRGRYLIGYFFSMFGAVLSEFAVAPLAPLLALALLYAILKNPGNRTTRIVIFVLMHLLLLTFMFWFCHQLETVGHLRNSGLLGPESHLLSLSTMKSILLNLIASILYANMLPLFSIHANLISGIALVVWMLLIWMGFVECLRRRYWVYLGIAFIFILTTITLYGLHMLPMNLPRRNMGYTLVLMPIVFAGLRATASHPLFTRLHPNQAKIVLITIIIVCTLPYIIAGGRYREFFFEEFQVSQEDRRALFTHLKHYAKPGDIIMTDWLSYLYFWEVNPQAPVPVPGRTARYDGYRLPIYYARLDYRSDPFPLNHYEASEMLKEINAAGGLTGVKRVWFVTLDDVYIRNCEVSPRHLLDLKNKFTDDEKQRFKDRLSSYATQQRYVAETIRTALPQQAFTTITPPPCDEKNNLDCLSVIAMPVPIETISKLFLSGIRYEDPRAIYYEAKGITKR